ncbi:NADase-type glycan-binding domain-containing protein [Spirochaeta cellobiosiphila]|uniref:NADase-type glycan-binding domain-containing protein n=1 Tax=Spirochaeta cellobiosiphila TaxID=504483 RepID=UPI0004216845|nr:hypothetical protein [Spirochaeta cellobiosiphila]
MKLWTILLLSLLINSGISADNYEDILPGKRSFLMDKNHINYENNAGLGSRRYVFRDIDLWDYQLVNIYGIPFVKYNESNPLLILKNREIVYVYSADAVAHDVKWEIFAGIEESKSGKIQLSFPTGSIKVSSYLTEGSIIYDEKFLKNSVLRQPWIEGAPGKGIGESITFEAVMDRNDNPRAAANGMYLFNGFVSFDKPHLYKYNARVKQFRVEDLDTDEMWTINLIDTPNPQYYDLKGHEGHTLRLSITDVYAGTKWEDTCLNMIVMSYKM